MSTGAPQDPPPEEEPRTSLRGTMAIVLMMAAFFVLTWLGMFALLLHRR